MNEDDLARRIAASLDHNLGNLPDGVVGRLAEARARALRARSARPALLLRLKLPDWIARHRMLFGVALPALFVLLAAGAVFFLQGESTQDPFDVETALLAGELPIHAYTDPGFEAWLRHTSYDQEQ